MELNLKKIYKTRNHLWFGVTFTLKADMGGLVLNSELINAWAVEFILH